MAYVGASATRLGSRLGGGLLGLVVALLIAGEARADDEARLEITCSVDGATVLVDGEPVGTTPLLEPIVLTPGGHRIRVERVGFEPFDELIVFFEEDEFLLEVELEPNAGIIRVVTAEPGARVLVDGAFAGVTPWVGEVAPGEREVRVTRDHYEPWSTRTTIEAGEEYVFEPTLLAAREVERVAGTPIVRQWWFWTGAALVVGGGIAAAVILSQDEQAPPVDVLIELPLNR